MTVAGMGRLLMDLLMRVLHYVQLCILIPQLLLEYNKIHHHVLILLLNLTSNQKPLFVLDILSPIAITHPIQNLDSLVYEWSDVLDDGFYNPAAPVTLPFSAPYTTTSPIPGNPTLNPAHR